MRILIEKGTYNDSILLAMPPNRTRKIYNKENVDIVIKEILEEYKFSYGKEHEDVAKLLNLVIGEYNIKFSDVYYHIIIVPKEIKITGGNIDEIERIAGYNTHILYYLTTKFKSIELIRHNKFLKYDRYDYGIIDKYDNYLDTFSIYDYKNDVFKMEFDWKFI